jgi:hypothetical protein
MYSRVALLKRPRPLVPWSSWILKPQTKHEEEVQREECNEEHSARNTSQVSTLFLAVVLPLYTVCVDGGEAFSFWHDKIVGRPVTLHAPQWAHTIVELVKGRGKHVDRFCCCPWWCSCAHTCSGCCSMGWTTQHTHSNGLDNVMGSTDGLAMAVNQVAKPWVRNVVAGYGPIQRTQCS